jgi:hypothetical protein
MANRVTGSEVKEIIKTSLTDSEVEPFITSANQLVTEKLADSDHSDDRLKEIERWLSAHFVAIRDPRMRSQSVGEARDQYHVPNLGKGLDSTVYGLQVKLLDTTGTLYNLGGVKVVFKVTPASA